MALAAPRCVRPLAIPPGAPITDHCLSGSLSLFTALSAGAPRRPRWHFLPPRPTPNRLANLNGTYYTGSHSDVVTVFDPSLGFVTGGGTFTIDGDRVNFGFVGKATVNNKKTIVKGSLLVIRHLPDGSIVRLKSNVFSGLAVKTDGSATFSGKANNSVDANNYDFTAYVKDVATPGSGADRFGLFYPLTNPRTSSTLSGLAASSTVLTGGNIQVPQP